VDSKEYQNALAEALEARRLWLEKTEFTKLKDECRSFHSSFSIIYDQLIKKRLIHEDPYKQEAKASEIKIPDTISLEGDRVEHLTVNLSAYDNQLDFLVNFSQFTVDFLTMDTIKRILALIKYIDWTKFTVNAPNSTTKAVVDVTFQAKTGNDPMVSRMITEALSNLDRATTAITGYLKEAADFNRESFKLQLRQTVTGGMSASAATVENIRKKFVSAMPRSPFYPDLATEVIKEDFSPGGEKLRETALKQLATPENKPKVEKAPISFKTTLLNGFLVISSVGSTLGEVALKLDENHQTFQNRKRSIFTHIKTLLRQMFNKEPEAVIYNIEYMDSNKGTMIKEEVNYTAFRADIDRRIRSFGSLGGRGGVSRLSAMEEKQLEQLLERAIRDAQSVQKTLAGLDEFFKSETSRDIRDKIKGIKPELSTMKNAIITANQKRHEYTAQMEEEEQLKKLGVNL
jgi:hypothetical protein